MAARLADQLADLRSEVTREASSTVVCLTEAAGACSGFPSLVLEARGPPRAPAATQRSAALRTPCLCALLLTRRAAQVLMAPILKLVAVPHKVMSEHGNVAATAALGAAQSHRVAARLAEQQQDRRAPVTLRARCAEYICRALAEWNEDVLAREPEIFEAAIAAGVGDASGDVRAPCFMRALCVLRGVLLAPKRNCGRCGAAARCARGEARRGTGLDVDRRPALRL